MDLSETLSKSNSSRSSVSPAPPLALTGGWVKAPASHCTVAGSNTQLWDRFSYVLAMHFLCINVLKHRSPHRNYLTPFLNIFTYTIYESHAYILCSCQVFHIYITSTLLRSTFCLSMSHHWLQLCQFKIKENKTFALQNWWAKVCCIMKLWIRISLYHVAARELRTQKPVYLSVGFALLCFGDPIFLFEHQQRHSECLLTLPCQTQLNTQRIQELQTGFKLK